MTIPVHSWTQRGKVALWRYRDNVKNYPGWHLTADRDAGLALLELFSLIEASPTTVYRTIAVSEPTPDILAVPNNQGGVARWWSPAKWRIAFDPSPQSADLWTFPPDQDPAVLTVGSSAIPSLIGGVTDLMHGEGDYSIQIQKGLTPGESSELWFWSQLRSGPSGGD